MTQPVIPGVEVADPPGRRLVQLCGAGALAYCSYAMCRSPLLPLFARELGADPPLIGLIAGASTLTGVVVKLPAGAWSDVLGRRALLVAGAIVFAVMPFVYLAVSGPSLLIALRFVHGSATAIFGPVASASLSDLAPTRRRGTWLSTYSTVQGAGQAVGPVIAGYVITLGRFDLAFVLAGLIALATPLIVAKWPSGGRVRSAAGSPFGHVLDGMAEVVRERRVLVASLAQAAQFLLNGCLNAFLPLYASDMFGMSAAGLGWLFALQTVTTLAIRPVMGAASDRLGRRALIVTGLVGCSFAVWGISQAGSVTGLGIAVFSYAAGVAVTTAATSAYITDVAPRARYGAAHGVFGTIYDVGDAAGPIVAGLLIAAWGYRPMFQTMAVVAVTAAVAFCAFSRPGTTEPRKRRHGTHPESCRWPKPSRESVTTCSRPSIRGPSMCTTALSGSRGSSGSSRVQRTLSSPRPMSWPVAPTPSWPRPTNGQPSERFRSDCPRPIRSSVIICCCQSVIRACRASSSSERS